MALESIRGHKLRSGLTLLGMVIGVFAIIVSVTAVKVIDVYFQDSMQFLGSSTFTISRTLKWSRVVISLSAWFAGTTTPINGLLPYRLKAYRS